MLAPSASSSLYNINPVGLAGIRSVRSDCVLAKHALLLARHIHSGAACDSRRNVY